MHVARTPGKMKLRAYRENIASLMVPATATYSASAVERVAHFSVFGDQHKHTPRVRYSPTGRQPPLPLPFSILCTFFS